MQQQEETKVTVLLAVVTIVQSILMILPVNRRWLMNFHINHQRSLKEKNWHCSFLSIRRTSVAKAHIYSSKNQNDPSATKNYLH